MCPVVLSQTSTQNFVSSLLCFNVDGGIDRKATLSHAGGIFVFQFLADVFYRIIEDCRFGLRVVVGSVSKLNGFGLGSVDLSLAGEAVPGHQVQHQIATL